jgi:IclR family acetate operon transcriptional repressor
VKNTATYERYSLVGVDRAVAILNVFDGSGSLALVDIARAAGLSETTTLRYVSSLASHELLEREDASGRYRLGLGLFQLGQRALGIDDPRKTALPVMEELLDRFEETVNLAMRHADELVLVEVLESRRSIRKGARVGDRDDWHASSLGKAVLAALPPDEAWALLERLPRPVRTRRTITSTERLLAHLRGVRRRGYAVDDEEHEVGLRCVGAAIRDRRGAPSFAISVSGPTARLGRERLTEIGGAVSLGAADISLRLGYLPERAR